MKTKSLIIALGATAILASCSGEEPKAKNTKVTVVEAETTAAVYSYDNSTTQVKWTGYKLPGDKKAGVGGEFKAVKVDGFTAGADPLAAMTGVTFELETASTSTNDSIRDGKLVNSFFGTMVNTLNITGSIKSLDGTSVSGDGILEITMNEVTLEQPVKYEITDEVEVAIWGTIDVRAFNGQAALDALTVVCDEKHEGVTWPDVDIKVFTTLTKK